MSAVGIQKPICSDNFDAGCVLALVHVDLQVKVMQCHKGYRIDQHHTRCAISSDSLDHIDAEAIHVCFCICISPDGEICR